MVKPRLPPKGQGGLFSFWNLYMLIETFHRDRTELCMFKLLIDHLSLVNSKFITFCFMYLLTLHPSSKITVNSDISS